MAGILSFLYLRYTTPQYAVSATLQIDERNELQSQVLGSMPGNAGKASADKVMFNEVFILQSPDLHKNAVDSLQANVHLWVQGRIKENEIYKERPYRILFDDRGYTGGGTLELSVVQKGTNYLITEGEKTYAIPPQYLDCTALGPLYAG